MFSGEMKTPVMFEQVHLPVCSQLATELSRTESASPENVTKETEASGMQGWPAYWIAISLQSIAEIHVKAVMELSAYISKALFVFEE